MNINIEIHFKATAKGMRIGSFDTQGLSPERVALDWWKRIQKEMSYHAKLEKVMLNNDEDITSKVMEVEKELSLKAFRASEDLPF